jgi:hypothetical protein
VDEQVDRVRVLRRLGEGAGGEEVDDHLRRDVLVGAARKGNDQYENQAKIEEQRTKERRREGGQTWIKP